MREVKLKKMERDRKDYKNTKIYNWTFEKPKKKRVTWAKSTFPDFDMTDDGEESSGTSADKGTSQRRLPERATKQRARNAFLGMRPYRHNRQKT